MSPNRFVSNKIKEFFFISQNFPNKFFTFSSNILSFWVILSVGSIGVHLGVVAFTCEDFKTHLLDFDQNSKRLDSWFRFMYFDDPWVFSLLCVVLNVCLSIELSGYCEVEIWSLKFFEIWGFLLSFCWSLFDAILLKWVDSRPLDYKFLNTLMNWMDYLVCLAWNWFFILECENSEQMGFLRIFECSCCWRGLILTLDFEFESCDHVNLLEALFRRVWMKRTLNLFSNEIFGESMGLNDRNLRWVKSK